MKFNKRNAGLTLTELLIVIGIIGVLGILIVSFLRSQIFKANDAKRKAEIKRIGIAVEEYEKDKDCYPTSVTCVTNDSLKPYLDVIPCDPVTKAPYYYEHDGSSCPKWYRIYADLDNEKDSDYQAGIGPDTTYSYYQSSPNAPALPSDPQGGGGGEIFMGCFSGVCQQIIGTICTPNWGVGSIPCSNMCGTPSSPQNECVYQ